MAVNYLKSAECMYKSSKILYTERQLHTSCYLAGYFVECVFNGVLEMSHKNSGNRERVYKTHLNTSKPSEIEKDPVVQISKWYKMNCVIDPDLKKFYCFDPSNEEYPHTIINGADKKWESNKRYDGDAWNSKPIAEQYQKDIDNLINYLNDLKSKGLVK